MFSISGNASNPALAAATTGTAKDSGRSRPPASSAAITPSRPSPASSAPCSATPRSLHAATARDALAAKSAGDNPSAVVVISLSSFEVEGSVGGGGGLDFRPAGIDRLCPRPPGDGLRNVLGPP